MYSSLISLRVCFHCASEEGVPVRGPDGSKSEVLAAIEAMFCGSWWVLTVVFDGITG
jgi:hypothetical protein